MKKQPILRLTSWNVRTMFPGLSDDLSQVDDSRKAAIINHELKQFNIDLAALQETRLPSKGSLREQDYKFFWQGKKPEEPRLHGVGFAVRSAFLPSVETHLVLSHFVINLKWIVEGQVNPIISINTNNNNNYNNNDNNNKCSHQLRSSGFKIFLGKCNSLYTNDLDREIVSITERVR